MNQPHTPRHSGRSAPGALHPVFDAVGGGSRSPSLTRWPLSTPPVRCALPWHVSPAGRLRRPARRGSRSPTPPPPPARQERTPELAVGAVLRDVPQEDGLLEAGGGKEVVVGCDAEVRDRVRVPLTRNEGGKWGRQRPRHCAVGGTCWTLPLTTRAQGRRATKSEQEGLQAPFAEKTQRPLPPDDDVWTVPCGGGGGGGSGGGSGGGGGGGPRRRRRRRWWWWW